MANKNGKNSKNPKKPQNFKPKATQKASPFQTVTKPKVNPFKPDVTVKENPFHVKSRKSILSTANSVGSTPKHANASAKTAGAPPGNRLSVVSVKGCSFVFAVLLSKQN